MKYLYIFSSSPKPVRLICQNWSFLTFLITLYIDFLLAMSSIIRSTIRRSWKPKYILPLLHERFSCFSHACFIVSDVWTTQSAPISSVIIKKLVKVVCRLTCLMKAVPICECTRKFNRDHLVKVVHPSHECAASLRPSHLKCFHPDQSSTMLAEMKWNLTVFSYSFLAK